MTRHSHYRSEVELELSFLPPWYVRVYRGIAMTSVRLSLAL